MAEFSDDIFFATITELNTKLKAKEFSVVELVRAFGLRMGAATNTGCSPFSTY